MQFWVGDLRQFVSDADHPSDCFSVWFVLSVRRPLALRISVSLRRPRHIKNSVCDVAFGAIFSPEIPLAQIDRFASKKHHESRNRHHGHNANAAPSHPVVPPGPSGTCPTCCGCPGPNGAARATPPTSTHAWGASPGRTSAAGGTTSRAGSGSALSRPSTDSSTGELTRSCTAAATNGQ
jgi:hypothetical protein